MAESVEELGPEPRFSVSAIAMSGLFDPAAGCAGVGLVFLTV